MHACRRNWTIKSKFESDNTTHSNTEPPFLLTSLQAWRIIQILVWDAVICNSINGNLTLTSWVLQIFYLGHLQYVSKKLMRVLTCLHNHFHLCYKWSSGRHKHSSERSISEAARRFGNLCVYKPCTLQKKPSDLRRSCATNACLEKCVEGQSLFLSHTIRSVSSSSCYCVYTD